MNERRLLLAGSLGPERIPVRLVRNDADWFKPPHVRDASAARDRIAAQVALGADVVLAPTWLTHRRALLPLAETRQTRPWTHAAIAVARDGVELGLERRAEAATSIEDPSPRRPRPLVGAALPALEDTSDPAGGRLLTQEAATKRDYRDQAGILADGGPDFLLVEPQLDEAGSRLAMAEAADTGLPIWVAMGPTALATTALEDWLGFARSLDVQRLLLPARGAVRQSTPAVSASWGVFGVDDDDPGGWLDAGASVVACLDRASKDRLTRLRAAIDEYEAADISEARAARQRWTDHLARAARVAPSGAAVWIGAPPGDPLADGFEWLVVDDSEIRYLPGDRFGLVVTPDDQPGAARLLQRGGLLAQRGLRGDDASSELRLLHVDDQEDPPLALYRRDR